MLYVERVRVLDTRDGWANIQALEHTEYTHTGRWQGYPGWLPAYALLTPEREWSPKLIVTEKWAPAWSTTRISEGPPSW